MPLPLPYTVQDEAIQGNFDAIKNEFPLSRKDLAVEPPHLVGDTGEPAFQNGWVNFDTTAWTAARFWKDPMGVVHLEGLIKSGTVGAGTPVFTLPVGYRPGSGVLFPTVSNAALGRVDVAPTGQVSVAIGNNAYVSLSGISFKQEN